MLKKDTDYFAKLMIGELTLQIAKMSAELERLQDLLRANGINPMPPVNSSKGGDQ